MKKRVLIVVCCVAALIVPVFAWCWLTQPGPVEGVMELSGRQQCVLRNSEGEEAVLEYGTTYSGTMEVLELSPVPLSDYVYITLPYSEEFVCELPKDGHCGFGVYGYRFSGTGAETVTITEDGITVHGRNMEYEVSSLEVDRFEANGQGASFVTLSFSGDGATVQSDAPYTLLHQDETYADCCSITSDGAKATLYGH